MYNTVALIPARGGSKGIPLKNIINFCGKPLIFWICKAVQNSNLIDIGFVSTENEKIKNTVEQFGFSKIKVISRDKKTTNDKASTYSVVYDFSKRIKYNNIVLLQAPCPFLSAYDIDSAILKYTLYNFDSLITVIRQKKFLWHEVDGLYIQPGNYKIDKRPRRQDWDGELFESGSCYISNYNIIKKYKNFIGGNIGYLEIPYYNFFEIDSYNDLEIMEIINFKLGLL